MALKKQYQMKLKQSVKRKKKRAKIKAKGLELKDFFYGKFYLKVPETKG